MATRNGPGGKPPASDESTVLSPAPRFTDPAPGAERGGVFDDETSGASLSVRSSEVSEIDAIEDPSRPRDISLPRSPPVSDLDDAEPATEVMRLAFSDGGTPPPDPRVRSIRLQKWRVAGERGAGPGQPSDPGGPGFAVPDTLHTPNRDATRVDSRPEAGPGGRADLEGLASDLEELERLVRSTKALAAGLDIEASRGLNAQLTAALHRVLEAKGRLK